jgi:glycosyltransferase involved in cell wall biosynthesis
MIERRAGKQADYIAWTRRATSRASLLHRREPFDVAHHVTFGTILLGSAMPRIGVPFVYGPLGGGQSTPTAARPWFEGSWRMERARNTVVRATPLNPLARSAVRRAVVLATNDETAQLAFQMGSREVLLMADTAIDESLIRAPRSRPGGRRLIWVGSARPRKGLNLAIQTLLSSTSETTLSVYGPSDDTVAQLAREYGVEDRVHQAGRVPWAEVQQAYRDHDAMLFTSLRESLGGQLVEAAAAGLPIIGLDLHGLASVLPPTAAEKVPLSAHSHHALAAAVEAALSPDRYAAMSTAAVAFASEQTWSSRAAAVSEVFRRLV